MSLWALRKNFLFKYSPLGSWGIPEWVKFWVNVILTWAQLVQDSQVSWPIGNWQSRYLYKPGSRGLAKLALRVWVWGLMKEWSVCAKSINCSFHLQSHWDWLSQPHGVPNEHTEDPGHCSSFRESHLFPEFTVLVSVCLSVFLPSLSQVRTPGPKLHMSWALSTSLVDIFVSSFNLMRSGWAGPLSNHLLVLLCITPGLMCGKKQVWKR